MVVDRDGRIVKFGMGKVEFFCAANQCDYSIKAGKDERPGNERPVNGWDMFLADKYGGKPGAMNRAYEGSSLIDIFMNTKEV